MCCDFSPITLTSITILVHIVRDNRKLFLILAVERNSCVFFFQSILRSLLDKTNHHINKKQLNEENVQLEGTFVCVKCNKKFGNKRNLTRHMDILHAGRFKFYCDQCKKGFSDSTNYKNHMNKHAGVLYRCTVCTKTFYNQHSRDYHMSVHTGVYRLTCDMCGKGFNGKMKYDKHISQHSR